MADDILNRTTDAAELIDDPTSQQLFKIFRTVKPEPKIKIT